MTASFRTPKTFYRTRGGRQTQKVSYFQTPASPSPSKAPRIHFDPKLQSPLFEYFKNGFKPYIDKNTMSLLTVTTIWYENNRFWVLGDFINSKHEVKEKWALCNEIQIELLLSSIYSQINWDDKKSLIFMLYKCLSKGLEIPTPQYLKYEVDSNVKYKPLPEYVNGRVKHARARNVNIIDISPHRSIGNLSGEYLIEYKNQNISTKLWVYEASLRAKNWKPSDFDEFHNDYLDIFLYEYKRSVALKISNYARKTSLTNLPLYLNISSPFYKHETIYNIYLKALEKNDNFDLLIVLLNHKILKLFTSILQELKPQPRNIIKSIKFTSQKQAKCELIDVSPIEMHYLLNNKLHKHYELYYYSQSFLWFVLRSHQQLKQFCGSNASNLTLSLSQGTKIKILCDKNNPIQFKYSRKTKKMWCNEFKYKTNY